jgi:hypothetical protein
LKSLTTVCCRAIWAGFVPDPRPTYQRTTMWSFPPTLTIWPGFAVDGTIDGATDAVDAGADAAVFDAGGAAEGAALPHAPTASATVEARAAIRMNLLLPICLLLNPLR